MSLTTSQSILVRNYINSVPVLAALPNTNVGNSVIAGALNSVANPDFIVWKTFVSQDEIMQNGFDWMQVDNLTVGKARIWEWLFDNQVNGINPSKANVRAGIDEAWKGTAAMLAVRAAIYVHCKRQALLIEQILASGVGTDASPATMGWEGQITPDDIEQARA